MPQGTLGCLTLIGEGMSTHAHTQQTSTTYNTFMYLTLPVPPKSGNAKVPLQQCIDAFVKEEVMDKSDAW